MPGCVLSQQKYPQQQIVDQTQRFNVKKKERKKKTSDSKVCSTTLR